MTSSISGTGKKAVILSNNEQPVMKRPKTGDGRRLSHGKSYSAPYSGQALADQSLVLKSRSSRHGGGPRGPSRGRAPPITTTSRQEQLQWMTQLSDSDDMVSEQENDSLAAEHNARNILLEDMKIELWRIDDVGACCY